jgi:hypothetical protein
MTHLIGVWTLPNTNFQKVSSTGEAQVEYARCFPKITNFGWAQQVEVQVPYEGVSKRFRTGHLDRELQIV